MDVGIFEQELGNAGLAEGNSEGGILDEENRIHVLGHVPDSSLERAYTIIQIKYPDIFQDRLGHGEQP